MATPEGTIVRCPNPDGGSLNFCLGPLPAGTYTTIGFRPKLTYSVPEGWTNMEDLPGNFLLLPPGSTLGGVNPGTSDYLGVYTSVVAPGHCTGHPSDTVPATFDGLVGYLTSKPSLAVTNKHDVSIGGLTGVALDLAIKGATGDGCSDGAYADIYVGSPPSDLVHGVIATEPIRVYLLRNGDKTLAIEMADARPGGSDLTDWWTAASALAAMFEFVVQ